MTAPDLTPIQEAILQTLEMKSDTQSLTITALATILATTESIIKEEARLLIDKKYIQEVDTTYRLTDMGRNLSIYFIRSHAYLLISKLVEENMAWVELPFTFSLSELIARLDPWYKAGDYTQLIENILLDDGVVTKSPDGKLTITEANRDLINIAAYETYRFHYLNLGHYPGVVEIIYGEDDDYSAADEVLKRED